MQPVSFCSGWTCRHLSDSEAPKPVTLPDDAMLEERRHALAPSARMADGLKVMTICMRRPSPPWQNGRTRPFCWNSRGFTDMQRSAWTVYNWLSGPMATPISMWI